MIDCAWAPATATSPGHASFVAYSPDVREDGQRQPGGRPRFMRWIWSNGFR
jgi:hypothetical protein